MSNLRKSVREQLFAEIPNYRNFRIHNWKIGEAGVAHTYFQYIGSAYADFEDGICTGITVYSTGSGISFKHNNEENCVEISDIFDIWDEGWRGEISAKEARENVIDYIVDAIKKAQEENEND